MNAAEIPDIYNLYAKYQTGVPLTQLARDRQFTPRTLSRRLKQLALDINNTPNLPRGAHQCVRCELIVWQPNSLCKYCIAEGYDTCK